MLILSIRTDKPDAEIGLYENGKKLAYETWHAHRDLSVTIHQKIQDLLTVKGLTFHKIEGIVVYKGPGSFTGLRIGISLANALAYGLSVPIVSTTGKDWQIDGIAQLKNGEDEVSIIPDYGSEPHVTQPIK